MKFNSNKIQKPHFRANSILSTDPHQRNASSSSLVYGLSKDRNFSVKTFLLELSETKKKTVTTKADNSVQAFKRFKVHTGGK